MNTKRESDWANHLHGVPDRLSVRPSVLSKERGNDKFETFERFNSNFGVN